jgi:hypothetical protein
MLSKTAPKKSKRKRIRPLQKLHSFAEWRGKNKNYDLFYYFGPASRVEPKLLETEVVFLTVAAECEEIAYTILSPDEWRFVNTCY